jgi:hypothetical protein
LIDPLLARIDHRRAAQQVGVVAGGEEQRSVCQHIDADDRLNVSERRAECPPDRRHRDRDNVRVELISDDTRNVVKRKPKRDDDAPDVGHECNVSAPGALG